MHERIYLPCGVRSGALGCEAVSLMPTNRICSVYVEESGKLSEPAAAAAGLVVSQFFLHFMDCFCHQCLFVKWDYLFRSRCITLVWKPSSLK